VIVKLWPGKTEQQKTRLAEAITKDVVEILHYGEESVSVAMEEVKSEDWVQLVYKPDIKNKSDKLYTKPGHDPNDREFAKMAAADGRRGNGNQESWLATLSQGTVRVVHWHSAD
jgi:4-oxalocrotonate tautomerase